MTTTIALVPESHRAAVAAMARDIDGPGGRKSAGPTGLRG